MDYIQQRFSVPFEYKFYFTSHLFQQQNPLFRQFLQDEASDIVKKICFVIDSEVAANHPTLIDDIRQYFLGNDTISLIETILVVPGGEACKNTEEYIDIIIDAVNQYGIDRHSYIAAIGGGAVLDMAGYAAAISHRGIRHIRIPTTVLSQNDSGVGVKNGINYDINGVLVLNGVSKDITVKSNITEQNNQILFDGGFSFNLTDFNLEPPTMFFLTVRNQIDVTYKIDLKR